MKSTFIDVASAESTGEALHQAIQSSAEGLERTACSYTLDPHSFGALPGAVFAYWDGAVRQLIAAEPEVID